MVEPRRLFSLTTAWLLLVNLALLAPGSGAHAEAGPAPASAAAADRAKPDPSTPAENARRPEVRPTDKPLLWRIEREPPSFLYGTIHVPDPRVLALPEVVQKAISFSDTLYTELPMGLPTKLAAAWHCMLPAGTTLRDLLPPELYARADALLRTKDLSIQLFDGMKIWVLFAALEMLDMFEELQDGDPLDEVLYELAARQGKRVGGLETVGEQVGAFDGLSVADQIVLLRKTVQLREQQSEQAVQPTEQLIRLYLAGDEEALLREALASMGVQQQKQPRGAGKGDAALRQVEQRAWKLLMIDRNERMAQRIVAHLRQEPGASFFFAVGAGHHGGEQGLLALLHKAGLRLSRLSPADAAAIPARSGADRPPGPAGRPEPQQQADEAPLAPGARPAVAPATR